MPRASSRGFAALTAWVLAGLLGVGGTARADEGDARPVGALRVNKVRQQTFLLEMGRLRILIDPWFTQVPLRGFLHVDAPALDEKAVGRLDIILVPDGRLLHAMSLRALNSPGAYCVVPTEDAARRFRHAGYRRVRVVRDGDIIDVAGARIAVSPAPNKTCGHCIGFHVRAAGRSVWHTGPVAPLAVEPAPGHFAQDHPAEVVLAPVNELFAAASWRTGQADARLLGELAGARFVLPHSDDIRIRAPWRLIADALAPAALVDDELRYSARLVPMEAGLWYRVARP